MKSPVMWLLFVADVTGLVLRLMTVGLLNISYFFTSSLVFCWWIVPLTYALWGVVVIINHFFNLPGLLRLSVINIFQSVELLLDPLGDEAGIGVGDGNGDGGGDGGGGGGGQPQPHQQ